MSALIVDTSSWISYFAGHGSPLIDEALGEGRILLSPVVAAELLSGTLRRNEQAELQDLLEGLELCRCDLGHWFRVGRLRAVLRKSGLSVSTPDAHVAQCALDAGAGLLSEDRVFEQVAARAPLQLAGRPGGSGRRRGLLTIR